MTNELPEDINEISDDLLDDIEPVGDEAQLYEHFRVVVDKGQEMIRVDKYLFDRLIPTPHATAYRKLPKRDSSWPTANR